MIDRYEGLLRTLVDAIGGPGGALDAKMRQALLASEPVTGALGAFATEVSENAGSITDAHVAALTSGGVDEESIFDVIVAAATGAGLLRLRAALRAIAETP